MQEQRTVIVPFNFEMSSVSTSDESWACNNPPTRLPCAHSSSSRILNGLKDALSRTGRCANNGSEYSSRNGSEDHRQQQSCARSAFFDVPVLVYE